MRRALCLLVVAACEPTAGKVADKAPPPSVAAADAGVACVKTLSGVIDESTRVLTKACSPIDIRGVVDLEVTLTVEAGTVLQFQPRARLDIGAMRPARLVVNGTASEPVRLEGGSVTVRQNGTLVVAGAQFMGGGGVRVAGGHAEITGSTFKDSQHALVVDEAGTLEAFDENQVAASPEPALVLDADGVGAVGAKNRFEPGARIEIAGGQVKRSATWAAFTYEITGETLVGDKATLTIAPGAELLFKDDQQLGIGYYSDGTLVAVGNAEKPIKLGSRHADATWRGLALDAHAVGCQLAHLEISGVDGPGIVAVKDASARIADVTCTNCTAPALRTECGARVKTANVTVDAEACD